MIVIFLVGLDSALSVYCSGQGLEGQGLGLEGQGLGLEGQGLGLDGPGLGLGPSGLVNIPGRNPNCILFYVAYFQDELDEFVLLWNSHRIRRTQNSHMPCGRPHIMYTIPQLYDTRDFLQTVDLQDLQSCKDLCQPKVICNENLIELCTMIMEETHLQKATDVWSAVTLYKQLRASITAIL